MFSSNERQIQFCFYLSPMLLFPRTPFKWSSSDIDLDIDLTSSDIDLTSSDIDQKSVVNYDTVSNFVWPIKKENLIFC